MVVVASSDNLCSLCGHFKRKNHGYKLQKCSRAVTFFFDKSVGVRFSQNCLSQLTQN